MPTGIDWEQHFETEIQQAKEARLHGNEGMARVCARRAAGIVTGIYLQEHYQIDLGESAIDRLRYLVSIPDLPDEIKMIAENFIVRVLPDHTLPVEADLIEDAYWLKNELIVEGES